MRLYTIQKYEFWENLQAQKRIAADVTEVEAGFAWEESHFNDKCCWGFKHAYEWLTDQMRKKIPSNIIYPIWAWPNKPDLRAERWAKDDRYTAKGAVRIEFDVDASQALLSDFDGWHYVLNYWHLSDTIEQNDKFDRHCIDLGGVSCFDCKPLKNKRLDSQIRNSWNKIFDLKKCRTIFSDIKQQVQVNVWSIDMSQVIKATMFQPAKK